MRKRAIWTGLLFTTLSSLAVADIEFSGFVSIGAGQVISNNSKDKSDTFINDYYYGSEYAHDTTYLADTAAGLRLFADVYDNATITTEITGHGSDNFNAEVNTLLASYEFQPKHHLSIGRTYLPLHFYSGQTDEGLAYSWIRPPVDVYTWQINRYNGASLSFSGVMPSIKHDIRFYVGREDSDDNPILGKLLGAHTDETWREMAGIHVRLYDENLDVRAHFLNGRNDRVVYEYVISSGSIFEREDSSQSFDNYEFSIYGTSVWLNSEYASLLAEYYIRNREKDPQVATYLVSVDLKWRTLTWHLTYSEYKQKSLGKGIKAEEHNTKSTGLRWMFHNQANVKLQYDRFDNTGGPAYDVGLDSEIISVAVDMAF